MSGIIDKRSDFPKISADPLHVIIDHGLPLHRFKKDSKNVKLFQESQIITRTNDYRPTPFPSPLWYLNMASQSKLEITDLKYMRYEELVDIFRQDMHDKREFESYDPLKGNSLVVTDYLDTLQLYIFSAGPSLSHLAILTSPKKSYSVGEHEIQLALDEITINETIDLSYPIRQIQISPLSTPEHIIVFIRTTSSIQVMRLDTELTLIHEFILSKQSEIYIDINYSMPVHVEPSPYFAYQYAFITNNGYTALIDGSNDRILFENVDPIPEHVNYSSRWRSCGFGKTPTTIYTASPECIKEYIARDREIQTKILAAPNDRIVGFKTSSQFLYCFSTVDVMVVMDRLLPERPVVTWLHKMRDSPPTEITIESLSNHQWRVVGFSPTTQKISMMHFHYINDPLKVVAPDVKVLELHNLTLSPYKFEEIYKIPNRIGAVGLNMNTIDIENGNVLFNITRLFEDGSVKLQYLMLEKQSLELDTIPKCEIKETNETFDKLLVELKEDMLPATEGKSELVNVDVENFKDYLHAVSQTGSEKLTDKLKLKIAYKVRELNSTTTLLDLFQNDIDCQKYSIDEIIEFLEELETMENIERARQIEIPGIFHSNQPIDQDLNQRLRTAHEKKIQLSSLMIRPLKDSIDTFQYLDTGEHEFKSTTTTKALSSLWTIDNTTRYNELIFPTCDTNRLLEKEKFPSVSLYKREESLLQQPETPMKRKKRSNSIVILSDDENDDITPKKLALSFQQSSQPTSSTKPSISSSFAMTSTQPLPGPFASRTKKPVVKKKKKTKASGFK